MPRPPTPTPTHPASDTITDEAGWWKIRSVMSGSADDVSTHLATWQVAVRGSPVHLVP